MGRRQGWARPPGGAGPQRSLSAPFLKGIGALLPREGVVVYQRLFKFPFFSCGLVVGQTVSRFARECILRVARNCMFIWSFIMWGLNEISRRRILV